MSIAATVQKAMIELAADPPPGVPYFYPAPALS
jgi:hypothetical protein